MCDKVCVVSDLPRLEILVSLFVQLDTPPLVEKIAQHLKRQMATSLVVLKLYEVERWARSGCEVRDEPGELLSLVLPIGPEDVEIAY